MVIIYPYRCKTCDNEFEVIKSVKDIDNTEHCKCGSVAERYIARTHFYGADDWNKAEYNPAFGQVVRSNKHRKELAKRFGVQEVGNTPADDLHKHFDQRRQEKYEAGWKKVSDELGIIE